MFLGEIDLTDSLSTVCAISNTAALRRNLHEKKKLIYYTELGVMSVLVDSQLQI